MGDIGETQRDTCVNSFFRFARGADGLTSLYRRGYHQKIHMHTFALYSSYMFPDACTYLNIRVADD